MSSFKPCESKREDFRRYLETSGVVDALTKVLVGLYEEPDKPNDAIDFLRQNLGIVGPNAADIEALRIELMDLRQKVNLLAEENCDLRNKLFQYENCAKPNQPNE